MTESNTYGNVLLRRVQNDDIDELTLSFEEVKSLLVDLNTISNNTLSEYGDPEQIRENPTVLFQEETLDPIVFGMSGDYPVTVEF